MNPEEHRRKSSWVHELFDRPWSQLDLERLGNESMVYGQASCSASLLARAKGTCAIDALNVSRPSSKFVWTVPEYQNSITTRIKFTLRTDPTPTPPANA